MKRYIKEYANDKKAIIRNNELMQPETKDYGLNRIDRALNCMERGLITVDECLLTIIRCFEDYKEEA